MYHIITFTELINLLYGFLFRKIYVEIKEKVIV